MDLTHKKQNKQSTLCRNKETVRLLNNVVFKLFYLNYFNKSYKNDSFSL